MSVEGVLRAVRQSVASYDDDWSDILSHMVTTNLLVAAAGIVSYKMFSGPMECVPPSFFPKSWATSWATVSKNSYISIFIEIAQLNKNPSQEQYHLNYLIEILLLLRCVDLRVGTRQIRNLPVCAGEEGRSYV
ncbi:unnamed protein product [Strongylus vulgaris]|uniref:Innexin n=1 Tax=Strongylus vulgaris TaxID=40348 RepID=A0A3P7L2S0_STRVU|nr:unnamed protein product [Strongylus vulgaris]